MQTRGNILPGIEIGNAWDGLHPNGSPTNWIVGTSEQTPSSSLRFLSRDDGSGAPAQKVKNVGVKWFVHSPKDDLEWGKFKTVSEGRCISLLANDGGKFELTFSRDGEDCQVILDKPGDFAVWGEGFDHSWRPIETSTIITVRWQPTE